MKKLIDIVNTDNEPNILNDMVFDSEGVKTNNMNKEFVSYEQALALKELEFDEPCWAWYNIPDEDVRYCYSEGRSPITNIQEEWNAQIDGKPVENIGLPTFSQAFRWFREKYDLDSFVKHLYKSTIKVGYYFAIDEYKGIEFQMDFDDYYKTYEEAELECLIKLIEIVKNK